MIIITAGHIDHGKTSLVRALTGIDADRLPEEKRRGMTIDLGFASLPLANGALASFVDVPGHHKFIRNMVSGAAGAKTAVLVIACDDGVMPQTREHLQIIDAVGTKEICVALTKSDIASSQRLAEVREEANDFLSGTRFAGAPIFPVSAHTGDGLAPLRSEIERMASRHVVVEAGEGFRLSVDRVFIVNGAGIVVTGVAHSGHAEIGQQVVISPQGIKARVRNIQANGRDFPATRPGGRYALNLTGPEVTRRNLHRGCWIIDEHLYAPTVTVDIVLDEATCRTLSIPGKGKAVHVHLGTDNLPARIQTFGNSESGPRLAHLTFARPTTAAYGDRLVLRGHESEKTFGGARIIDSAAPAKNWRNADRIAALEAMDAMQWQSALEDLANLEAVDVVTFARARNLHPVQVERYITSSGRDDYVRNGSIISRKSLCTEVRRQIEETMRAEHEGRPHGFGISLEVLARKMPIRRSPEWIRLIVEEMIDNGMIVRSGRFLRLASFVPALSENDRRKWRLVRARMEAYGSRPPQLHELARELEWEVSTLERFFHRVERHGLVSLAAPRRYFTDTTLLGLANQAMEIGRENRDGTFSIAEFNRRTGIGRNLSVHVLEYFDRLGLTQRTRNARQFKHPPGSVLPLGVENPEGSGAVLDIRKSNASGDVHGLQIR